MISRGPVTCGTGGSAVFAAGTGAGVVTTGALGTGVGVGTAGALGAHAPSAAENAAAKSARNEFLVVITCLGQLVDNLIAWSVPASLDRYRRIFVSRRARIA